jgi:ubiquinone/menaquinone biosynthesis C-methylase UbiE
MNPMTDAVQVRYGELAEGACCLSCGGAADNCDPQPGQICLDLGSGRGTDVMRMAEAVGPEGRAFGVDTTDAMLEKARRTAEKLGVTNATFMRATFDRVPLPDGSVDWVISNCALNHAPDKPAVWREIARVLKPGGRFVISDIYAVEEIAAEHRRDPAKVAECWAGAVTRADYMAQIAAAGLADVRVVEESQPYAKGAATVASFTVAGTRSGGERCC